MRSTILLIIALLFVNLALARAQSTSIEYGEIADLKGVEKIFIDTGSNLKMRNEILKAIKKKLPNLTITNSAEEAEVIVQYFDDSGTIINGETAITTVTNNTNENEAQIKTTTAPNVSAYVGGRGSVFINTRAGKKRMIINGTYREGFISKPHKIFAKEFIKSYQNANR
jgi:hypothetical protein